MMSGNSIFDQCRLRNCFRWVVRCLGDPGSRRCPGLPGGVGVRNLISSLDSTISGSRGTNLDALNPALVFVSLMVVKKAALKAIKRSTFVTWLICDLTSCSIC
jgi:hypothetical protein